MDFLIKKYNSDPSIDFNKIQAEIYNSVVSQFTGVLVTPEQIKERIERDKFDPDGILYAFTKDNVPLAYIRYYIYPSGAMYIGYPWSTPHCSPDIQEQLFNELKRYLKKKFPSYTEATMGMADNLIVPFHEFAKNHQFERGFSEVIYHINITSFSQNPLGEFSYREATKSDLKDLVKIAQEDLDFIGQETILNEEEIKSYLTKEILPIGNCAVLLNANSIIGAIAPLRSQHRLSSSFTFIKYQSLAKKFEDKRILLFIALAKLLNEKGLTGEKILLSIGKGKTNLLSKLEEHGLKIVGGGTEYTVKFE